MYQTLLKKAVLVPIVGAIALIVGAVGGWFGKSFKDGRIANKAVETDA